MIPEIRRHVELALGSSNPHLKETFMEGVLANALEIYARLAQRGLASLAYPRPLAMTALVRVRQESGRGFNL